MENSQPYKIHNVIIPSILIGIIAASLISSVILYSIQTQQYAQLNDNLEKQLEESISAKSFHVSQVAALHISNIMQTTQTLAGALAIQDNNQEIMARLLDSALTGNDVVQSFFVFDKNAILLYTTSNTPAAKALTGTMISNQTAFVGAKESGSTFVSDLTQSLDGGSYRIFVSSPIVDPTTQEFEGVIGASILSETLVTSIKNDAKLQETDALSLIDPNGNIITSSSGNATIGKNILSDEILGQLPGSIRDGFTQSLVDAVEGRSGVYTLNLNENPELNNPDASIDTAMIAYSPATVDDKIVMITFVVESANIQDLTRQSENPLFSSTFVLVYSVLATMAAFAAAIIIINRRLTSKVVKATSALNKSNSDLRKLADELKDKTAKLEEADIAKEEFSAMITHELKTPLVPIIGYSELLLDGTLGTLTEKQRKKVHVLHENATSLLRLISDLLDVRKLELGQMKFDMIDAPVEQIVRQALASVKLLAQKKNIQVVYKGHGDGALLNDKNQSTLQSNPKGLQEALNRVIYNDDEEDGPLDDKNQSILQCDPKRLQQVLHNLLTNAIKFVPEDTGRIEVQTKVVEGNNGNPQQPLVLFAVKDNGTGIPKDKQQNLFRKFYQVDTSLSRNVGGTGLGLAISKGIVEAHNGKIWFESEPGASTTFYFTIPLAKTISDPPVNTTAKEEQIK